MSENTKDEEREVENPSGERSVIDDIRQRRAKKGDESERAERSGSGLRTLLLVGFSFIAGYLVGKSQSTSDLREELREFGGSDEGPMEIEIHDTDGSSAPESTDEGNETAEIEGENDESNADDEDGKDNDGEESDEE